MESSFEKAPETGKDFLLEEMKKMPLERMQEEYDRNEGNILWVACFNSRLSAYMGALSLMHFADDQISKKDFDAVNGKLESMMSEDAEDLLKQYPKKHIPFDVAKETLMALSDKLMKIGKEILARSNGEYVVRDDVTIDGVDVRQE